MSDFDELAAERETADHWRDLAEQRQKRIHELVAERDQIKAENEELLRQQTSWEKFAEETRRSFDEVEGLRKDAERYRWLKANGGPICYAVDAGRLSLIDLDAEIDSGMELGHD